MVMVAACGRYQRPLLVSRVLATGVSALQSLPQGIYCWVIVRTRYENTVGLALVTPSSRFALCAIK